MVYSTNIYMSSKTIYKLRISQIQKEIMIYRKLGKLGWDISAVAMGTWNIGNQWGNVDEKTAINAITTAFEKGVNLFDTAEGYGIPNGLSEQRLAKALNSKRDQIFIASKIGMYGRGEGYPTRTDNAMSIKNSAYASLHRLKTEYHDILFCHEQNPEHPEAYMEAFEMLKKEGKLKLSGVSTDKLDVIKKFNENGKCDIVEIDYSILQPEHEQNLIPYCKDNDIAIIVRGALHKGLLSGKYDKNSVFEGIRYSWNKGQKWRLKVEQHLDKVNRLKKHFPENENLILASLRYLFTNNENLITLFGAKDSTQVAMNAKAGERFLTDEENKIICELRKK